MKKKFKKPNIKLSSLRIRRQKTVEERVSDAISTVPKITNETVTKHREDVLSSARKYIYPLQHSKHHIVRISVSIFVVVIVGFVALCSLDLYKFQGTSGFIYDVTKILPFPVAKSGGSWIGYESYLFELRRNMHYYNTLQQADFSTPNGKVQLDSLKQQALDTAIQDSLVSKLAKQNKIKVTDSAVNYQLSLAKSENRLGTSDQVFKEVLSQYWGWNEDDFKKELKQQITDQDVVSKLDVATHSKANLALSQLQQGADFATLAAQVSQDTSTKSSGGEYANALTINDSQVSPIITQELFKLKPGQISGVINTGYSLEILKLIDSTDGSVHAAHIEFNFQPIKTYTAPLENSHKQHVYIKI
jgi:hypothetical protein